MPAPASPLPTRPTPSILVVEDDPDINAMIVRFLGQSGYGVAGVADGRAMDAALARQSFDLILLDLMLPDENGLDLCRRVRAGSAARVIMITALADVNSRVAGLEAGADDYISKPFELVELHARVRAVLRRSDEHKSQGGAGGTILQFAGWRFEPERRALYTESGVRMPLTGAETDLMLVLCRHAGQVVTRRQLIVLTRGNEDAIDERTIDLLVSRLRRKLAQGGRQLELIRTVRGGGYMFNGPARPGDGERP